ncbi:hypothetical protein BZG36_04081 [Bifiguratus adelaidae]|uniref:Phospholipase/carboxylesterase/thioesterase domain-containing protein n=1 Tax=Bifiguratus adelaidae TaxID=1938954 RepID=A0A261XX90_9FUNG|nr:hypothetical protein BZG36_04081 [Bifiguratus adelaidae]
MRRTLLQHPRDHSGLAEGVRDVYRRGHAQMAVIRQLDHLVYLPPDYDASRPWPLVLFLHGYGERGHDIDRIRFNGLPALIDKGSDFPFVMVAPQLPESTFLNQWESDVLNQLLVQIQDRYTIDDRRIYLTGLSMGGYGTWDMAITYPTRFAAIAPICGGGDPSLVHRIKHLPVWAFHGARDPVVPVERSNEMIQALRDAGSTQAQLTIFPELEHNSWDAAYTASLFQWLLSHSK